MKKNLFKKQMACLLVAVMCLNITKVQQVNAAEAESLETQEELEESAESTMETVGESETESSVPDIESSVSEVESAMPDESASLEETTAEEDSSISEENSEEEGSTTGINESEDTYYRYLAEDFEVEYNIDAKWDGHYNATVVIHNTGKEVIDNWYMTFQSRDEIENIYNAVIYEHNEDKYIIKNAQYNQDIEAGNSVSFGFTASYQDQIQIPKAYELLTSIEQADDEEVQITYEVVNDWGGGFIGKIHIRNNTDAVLEDWGLGFDFENTVESFWTAVIVSRENGHYIIKNAGYNANIEAGKEIEIGFNCSNGDARKEPQNFRLTSSKIKSDTPQKPQKPEREPEPLVDIGEAYFKDMASENDVATDAEYGIMYVKNQILVSALDGLEKDFFKNVVSDIGAEIVGYIELTNDYQIEFIEEKTGEELENYIKYLNSLSFIDSAGLNIVIEQEPNLTTTDDAVYQEDGKTPEEIWDESNLDGYNWGLKALKVSSAWDYIGESNTVKVGIIDSAFDTDHEDLHFEYVFGDNIKEVQDHGTMVAGVIAAGHNNGVGISGVATDVRLYGYAWGNKTKKAVMEYKFALANLVGNRVKVINVSMGWPDNMVFAASRGQRTAEMTMFSVTLQLEDFLSKLKLKGYDFVIVTSAGNEENLKFVKDDSRYGYSQANLEENALSGNVLAEYSGMFTGISDFTFGRQIIVVGAVDRFMYWNFGEKVISYKYADFSNVGDRVDVCAPGTEIIAPIPDSFASNINVSGYYSNDGTSFAAPYIAGLAGLMYQVNPGLDASRIKEILRENIGTTVSDRHGNEYGMPDASKCIQSALADPGDSVDTILPNGFVLGRIVDKKGNGLYGAEVTVCRTNIGESNLSDFCTVEKANTGGIYEIILVQGTYDFIISCEGYLPCVVRNVNINPDETLNMEDIVMGTSFWGGLNSTIEGKVCNALNDNSISDAIVRFRKGWNNSEGEYVTDKKGNSIEIVTDLSGNFKVGLPVGSYTIEVGKSGFITGYFNVVSMGGNDNQEQKFVLAPVLSDEEYRIVLTWGDEPKDLDSHLTYYQNGIYKMHVYYSKKFGMIDGKEAATLDYDDTSSYGPETVTITLNAGNLNGGVFRYSVHDYSNAGLSNTNAMSLSDAVVRVYKGNQQIKTYSIPQNKYGTVWHVFDITEQGVETVNEFYYESWAARVG